MSIPLRTSLSPRRKRTPSKRKGSPRGQAGLSFQGGTGSARVVLVNRTSTAGPWSLVLQLLYQGRGGSPSAGRSGPFFERSTRLEPGRRHVATNRQAGRLPAALALAFGSRNSKLLLARDPARGVSALNLRLATVATAPVLRGRPDDPHPAGRRRGHDGRRPDPGPGQRRTAVLDGFQVQTFASEPEIRPPAATFDERGRMRVIEYLQYPVSAGLRPATVDQYPRTEYDRVPEPPPRGPRGADRIEILEDTDGDGKADKVTTFLDGLNLATGHGGVVNSLEYQGVKLGGHAIPGDIIYKERRPVPEVVRRGLPGLQLAGQPLCTGTP